MNREIKFKGYAVEEMINSQWIEDAFGVENIEYTNGKISTYLLTPYGDYEVIKKSVGQYTGVKDKNGREVYEGDIVKANDNGRDLICEVVYERAMFLLKWGKSSCFYYGLCAYELEVIGNIYENPELLEEIR